MGDFFCSRQSLSKLYRKINVLQKNAEKLRELKVDFAEKMRELEWCFAEKMRESDGELQKK